MSGTGFMFVSQRIEEEKAIKHIGTASVDIGVLSFAHSNGLNQENVERLKRMFRIERGFRPEELPNRIPAVIDEGQLHQILNTSEIPTECLLSALPGDHAKLEFPSTFRLECLRGRHRVEAARQALPYADKRWIVDLYPADISKELKCALIDEYASERKLDDGEFYYKIREFQGIFGPKSLYFEKRWWARLATASESSNKKERLEQLLKHAQFAPGFDAFRHVPALYSGMRLSMINKMICLKCHDLLLSSLSDIKDFYYFVFDSDEGAMQRLSKNDIEALQLTAPGACQAEARALYGRIKAGALLEAFDDHERDVIWERLCLATTERLVPSLFAFFENLKYLKGPADCMKRLVSPKRGETIFSALESAFSDSRLPGGRCPIQVSRTTFKSAQVDKADRLDLLYRQLWLFAFREYRDMPRQGKEKLAGPRGGESDETLLFEFASLADKSGFHSEEIQELVQKDPDREMICRFLKAARKPDQYRYNNLEDGIAQVHSVLQDAEPLQDADSIIDHDMDEHEKPPNRCGVPNNADQRRDKTAMFLNKLHRPIGRQDASLTSFFIQRSWYLSFFGTIGTRLDDLEDLDGFGTVHHQRDPDRSMATIRTQQLDEQLGLSELELQERGYCERLEAARGESQQLEAKLQLLRAEQQEKEASLKRLEQVLSSKDEQLQKMAKETQAVEGRFQSLKMEEESLRERAEANTITNQKTIFRDTKEWQTKLTLLKEAERRQNEKLRELEESEKSKKLSLERLNAEERNQKDLLSIIQAKVDQLTKDKKDLQSVVTELATKESEHQQQSRVAVSESGKVRIEFRHRVWNWALAHELLVDPSEPSEVQRVTTKYLRKGFGIFDRHLRVLTPRSCFERVTSDESYAVYLLPNWEVETSRIKTIDIGTSVPNAEEIVENEGQNKRSHKTITYPNNNQIPSTTTETLLINADGQSASHHRLPPSPSNGPAQLPASSAFATSEDGPSWPVQSGREATRIDSGYIVVRANEVGETSAGECLLPGEMPHLDLGDENAQYLTSDDEL